jgi:hypothetical protein
MHEVDVSNAALLERRRAEKAALVEQDKKIARFIQEREAREQVAKLLTVQLRSRNRCNRLYARVHHRAASVALLLTCSTPVASSHATKSWVAGFQQQRRHGRSRSQAETEEREASAAAKELETARLRALQQKATDHKSELDELQARR